MSQLQKYKRLKYVLQGDVFVGSDEIESGLYFKELQRLQVDLLIGQIEVAQKKRQIAALEAKIDAIRQQQRQINQENHKQNESSSEELVKDFVCPIKECGKRFQKESGLSLHSLLVHNPTTKWKQGMVFRLSLEEQP